MPFGKMLKSTVLAACVMLATLARADATTGSISGTVTAAATGLPVDGAVVTASWIFFSPQKVQTTTDANGHYQIDGLEPNFSAYDVVAKAGDFLVAQGWPGSDCFSYDPDTYWWYCGGQSVQVTAGQTVTGIDFALNPGGVLQGHVTRADNDLPVAGAQTSFPGLVSDSDGFYRIASVPPDQYSMSVGASGYVTKFNDGQQCDAFADCSGIIRTPFAVVADQTVTLDIALTPAVSISGTASIAGDPAAPRPPVWIYDESDAGRPHVPAESTQFPATSAYQLDGLIARTYSVRFGDPDDTRYLSEYFDDVPCPQDPCDLTGATLFTATAGQQITAVDGVVTPRQTVTGRVIDVGTQLPIVAAAVQAVDLHQLFPYNEYLWSAFADTQSDENGHFVLVGIPAGKAFALRVIATTDYLGWQSPDVICDALNYFCQDSQTPVYAPPTQLALDQSVDAGDVALTLGAHVSGQVTSSQDGRGVADTAISFYVDDVYAGGIWTDLQGNYVTDALRAGTFKLVATAGTHAQMYDHVDCPDSSSCDLSQATAVVTEVASTASDVDFSIIDPDTVFVSGFDN